MVKINGYKVHGTLTRGMTARTAEQYIQENYDENKDAAESLVQAAWMYGISARSADDGRYFAVYRKQRVPARFLIEEGTAKDILSDGAETVALSAPVGYSKRSIPSGKKIHRIQPISKEATMAPRGSRTATRTRKGAKPAPAPEPEELEEEDLEDEVDEEELEDEELEDEEDDDLDDEVDEDDEDDEEEEGEEDDDDDEPSDYTPYLTKDITPTMEDFAEWINREVGDINVLGAEDPVRLVALAGTLRMEFQRSDFNKERRAERQAASAKAAKATAAKRGKAAAAAEEEEEQPRARRGKAAPAKAAPAKAAKGKAAAEPARPVATKGPRSGKAVPASKGKAATATVKPAGRARNARSSKAAAPF